MRPDRVCIHEAGHAVAAWHLGAMSVMAWPHPVAAIEGSDGACAYSGVISDDDHALISLAGREAERRLLGRTSPHRAYSKDLGDAVSEVGLGEPLTLARCRAGAFVIRHQREIFALAARMQVRGYIDTHDLAEVTGVQPGMERLIERMTETITHTLAEYQAAQKRKAKRCP